MKLFFLGRNINTKWLSLSFMQGNGQKKTSEVFIWIFKSGKNKQPRYAAIPSSSHRQNDANTSLWRTIMLAFIGSRQLLIGGEGDSVQETSILEGSHFALWDLDLLAVLSSSTNSFLLAQEGSVLNQICLCLPLPALPLPRGVAQREVWAKGDLRHSNSMRQWFLRRPFTLFALVCKPLKPHLTHFLTETIPCLILTAEVKVYLGSVKTICGF